MILKLKGRGQFEVPSISKAQALYSAMRDASGEGASTWPSGFVSDGGAVVAKISYNGRAWDPKFPVEIE